MGTTPSPTEIGSSVTIKSLDVCGVCEQHTSDITRVEEGVRYCSTCYARLYKRLMCRGCGMFARLLKTKDDPRCRSCVFSMPCVRCRRTGRPVGKMTDKGPACNSCYKYFTDPLSCEICGTQSRRCSAMQTSSGQKNACPKCLRSNHRTCSFCRKHRLCEPTDGGKWACRLCRDMGEVACGSCSVLMPAGMGARCKNCYWLERWQRSTNQLTELLEGERAREAFKAFSAWLLTQGSAQRAALKLKTYAEFFVKLENMVRAPWTAELILARLGTATLRKYELPVRWLEQEVGVKIAAVDRKVEADIRRVRAALENVPERTLARNLLDAFKKELNERQTMGKISERSMRLAFRPAVALLEVEDSSWMRSPTQASLERYLALRPGQRAAITTFLGFLRTNHGIVLKLPPKSSLDTVARKRLEQQFAVLMRSPIDSERITKHWSQLALRYFHYLSVSDARTIAKGAIEYPIENGTMLSYSGQDYWIPPSPVKKKT